MAPLNFIGFRGLLLLPLFVIGVAFEGRSDNQLNKVDIYKQAVHILGGNASVVHKWVSDIRFVSIGDPELAAFAAEVVKETSEITKLELKLLEPTIRSDDEYISLVKASQLHSLGSECKDKLSFRCFNFVVLFTDFHKMIKLVKLLPLRGIYLEMLNANPPTPCFFVPYQRAREFKIFQAFVFVNKHISWEMKRTCLAEEIYQSFGLFEDYTGSRYFSFNNKVERKLITEYDKALLASLYDPRVRPGTPVNFVVGLFLDRFRF